MSQSATSVATDHHISKHDFGPSGPMVAMLHLAAPSRRSESSRGDLCCELGGRNVRGSNVARLPITCKPAALSQRRLRARRPRRAFFFAESRLTCLSFRYSTTPAGERALENPGGVPRGAVSPLSLRRPRLAACARLARSDEPRATAPPLTGFQFRRATLSYWRRCAACFERKQAYNAVRGHLASLGL